MSTQSILARATASTALLALLSGCGHETADPRTGPALVRISTAQGGGNATRDFTGVVSARVQSDLGFRVPGKIVARLVDAGQTVRRGQPLMRIDRTDLALATTAQLNSVTAAKARALQTEADEKRYRDLVSAGAVSASSYDQAKAAADAARAQLLAAEATAGVARNQAGYSLLVADADGVVVETTAEPGQVVAAGQTVVKLAHSGPREATINLPETLRPPIGSTARASLFEGHGVVGSARLRQLSDAADPQTRTFDARYVLQGPAAAAPLGATVTISLPAEGDSGALRVPLSAIYDAGHGPGVWTISGNAAHPTAAWRAVRLSSIDDESATVASGLGAGERFVTLGAHLLHQGQAVRLSTDTGLVQ